MKYQALLNGTVKEITVLQADAMIQAETMAFGASNVSMQTDDNGTEVMTLIPYSSIRQSIRKA